MATRLTLGSICTTSAIGAVLVAFACGNTGTTGDPTPMPDLATPDTPDMAMTAGAPTLTGATPKLVSTAGGTSVTLTGTGFTSGTTVKIGTVTVPATDIQVGTDGTTITIKAPARLGMPGKVDVSVATLGGQTATLTNGLSYFLGQVNFGTPTATPTDAGPRCIVVADMNKDTNLDLVTANFNSNTASVFLGSPTGAFTLKLTRGVGTGPYNVSVGDVDGDGFLDVVSANKGSDSVSVMSGDGFGNLSAPVSNTSFVGIQPQSAVIVDVNNDNALDLVVSNFGNGNNNVSLLMGNKTKTFSSSGSTMITVNGNNLYTLVADDFNKDNKLDVVGVHQSSGAGVNVSTLINKISGAMPFFTTGANKSTGNNPTGVAVGDFDNDGNKDLAVTNQGSNSVSFLKGSATGTFTDTANGGITTVGTGPEHLAAFDVNQDGNLDLIVANYAGGNLSLLLGKGDGTFAAATPVVLGNTVKPNWVAVGDFNKDGRIDVVATDANTVNGQVLTLLNTSQ